MRHSNAPSSRWERFVLGCARSQHGCSFRHRRPLTGAQVCLPHCAFTRNTYTPQWKKVGVQGKTPGVNISEMWPSGNRFQATTKNVTAAQKDKAKRARRRRAFAARDHLRYRMPDEGNSYE
jgi:hypothetical protein